MDFVEIHSKNHENPYLLCCGGVFEHIDLLRIQKQKSLASC